MSLSRRTLDNPQSTKPLPRPTKRGNSSPKGAIRSNSSKFSLSMAKAMEQTQTS